MKSARALKASQSSYQTFEQALEKIFSALLDLMLAQGMTVKRFSEIAECSMVKAMKARNMSTQEIIERSGLSKKTILSSLKTEPQLKDKYRGLELFMSNWQADPDFPEVLSLNRSHFPCWEDLCRRYGKEMTPAHLLKTLSSKQCVIIQNNQVHFAKRIIYHNEISEKTLNYISFAMENLIQTFNHNLFAEEPSYYEQTIWSPNVKQEKTTEFEQFLRQTLEKLAKDIHQYIQDHNIEAPEHQFPLSTAMGVGVNVWKKN